jgi:hypothetical protein
VQYEVNLLVVIDKVAVWEMNELFGVYMCIASWRNKLQRLFNNIKKGQSSAPKQETNNGHQKSEYY